MARKQTTTTKASRGKKSVTYKTTTTDTGYASPKMRYKTQKLKMKRDIAVTNQQAKIKSAGTAQKVGIAATRAQAAQGIADSYANAKTAQANSAATIAQYQSLLTGNINGQSQTGNDSGSGGNHSGNSSVIDPGNQVLP